SAPRRDHRELSVPERHRPEHQHRGALARHRETRRRQGRGRRDAGAGQGQPAKDSMTMTQQTQTQAQVQPTKAFPVSWDQFHRDARALAWRLAEAGPFQAIVAITRGGLVPAAIIARELNLRLIDTVCISSYHEYTKQGDLRVIKEVAESIA